MKTGRLDSLQQKRGRTRTGRSGPARPAQGPRERQTAALDFPYRKLFENAPDGKMIVDAVSGVVREANKALTDLSGYRAADIRGKKLWEIPLFKATDAGMVVFRELRKQKRIYYDDLPLETREGKRLTVEMTCSLHSQESGKLILCEIRDVTRQQQLKADLWNAEIRFKALFQQAGIGIALLDREGKFVDGNATLSRMLGGGPKELCTLNCADISHEEGRAVHAELLHDLISDKRSSYHVAQRCLRMDGTSFWALVTVSVVRNAGGLPQYFILTMEDISDRKRAEEIVINSRDFYRSLIYELPNPIRITDTDAKCDYVNRAWLEFTNRRMEQEVGEGWTVGIHPEDRARVMEIATVSFRNRSPYATEYRLAHRGGEFRWVVEFGRPFSDIKGTFAGYISSCYDVHERKAFEDRLHTISFTDELTGLLNRRGFFFFGQQQLKQANRSRKGFLFLYADLDGLKSINDTYGHQEGDMALVETARLFQEVFRESDIIARLGGDEFAAIMTENTGTGDEQAILNRLRQAIEDHNARPGRRFLLSVSTGIKQYDPDAPCSLDELISRADRLMYEEKKGKRA